MRKKTGLFFFILSPYPGEKLSLPWCQARTQIIVHPLVPLEKALHVYICCLHLLMDRVMLLQRERKKDKKKLICQVLFLKKKADLSLCLIWLSLKVS